MKNLFNKLFVSTLLISAILLSSCGGDDEPAITEAFTFTVDGTNISFTIIDGGVNLSGRLVAQGTEGDNHEMEVSVLNTSTGTFTEADIDTSVGFLESNYDLVYTDASGNDYSYYNDETDSFTITITAFGDEEESLISGTFSGTLSGSLLNGETAPESVQITNGSFTISRSDSSLENLW